MRLITLCLLATLSGCTVTQSAQYAVARYCALPEQARSVSRAAVGRALAPNRLLIECGGGK